MPKVKEPLICESDLRKAAKVLRAINHKLRLEILYMLQVQKKLTVTDIYEALKIEQSICSQHLNLLRQEGIVSVERAGKHRYYMIVHSRLKEINIHAKAISEAIH